MAADERIQRKISRVTVVVCLSLAFGGSMLFGASIAYGLQLSYTGLALWMTCCAGLGWAALIPALWLFAKRDLASTMVACLVAIAWGEAPLILCAMFNFAGAPTIFASSLAVLSSNGIMASLLTLQLRAEGVPPWKTLTLWMLALNGVGALAFWLTYPFFRGLA